MPSTEEQGMSIEKFMGTLERFAGHLRNEGEIKAAEAIEAVLKLWAVVF